MLSPWHGWRSGHELPRAKPSGQTSCEGRVAGSGGCAEGRKWGHNECIIGLARALQTTANGECECEGEKRVEAESGKWEKLILSQSDLWGSYQMYKQTSSSVHYVECAPFTVQPPLTYILYIHWKMTICCSLVFLIFVVISDPPYLCNSSMHLWVHESRTVVWSMHQWHTKRCTLDLEVCFQWLQFFYMAKQVKQRDLALCFHI